MSYGYRQRNAYDLDDDRDGSGFSSNYKHKPSIQPSLEDKLALQMKALIKELKAVIAKSSKKVGCLSSGKLPVLIGSRAARYWDPEFRSPGDWDLVITPRDLLTWVLDNRSAVAQVSQWLESDGSSVPSKVSCTFQSGESFDFWLASDTGSSAAPTSTQMMLEFGQSSARSIFPGVTPTPCAVASLPCLYAIKKSHIYWPIHWAKNIADLHQIRNRLQVKCPDLPWWPQGKLPDSSVEDEAALYLTRMKEIEKRCGIPGEHINLNVTNEQFFKPALLVDRYVEHDDIHELVKYGEKPLYDTLKLDGSKAAIDRGLWEALPLEDKLRCVREECMVIALERYIIPEIILDSQVAYFQGLRRVCTTLTKGFFREFAIMHYSCLEVVDKDLMEIYTIHLKPLVDAKKAIDLQNIGITISDSEGSSGSAAFHRLCRRPDILPMEKQALRALSIVVEGSEIRVNSTLSDTYVCVVTIGKIDHYSQRDGGCEWPLSYHRLSASIRVDEVTVLQVQVDGGDSEGETIKVLAFTVRPFLEKLGLGSNFRSGLFLDLVLAAALHPVKSQGHASDKSPSTLCQLSSLLERDVTKLQTLPQQAARSELGILWERNCTLHAECDHLLVHDDSSVAKLSIRHMDAFRELLQEEHRSKGQGKGHSHMPPQVSQFLNLLGHSHWLQTLELEVGAWTGHALEQLAAALSSAAQLLCLSISWTMRKRYGETLGLASFQSEICNRHLREVQLETFFDRLSCNASLTSIDLIVEDVPTTPKALAKRETSCIPCALHKSLLVSQLPCDSAPIRFPALEKFNLVPVGQLRRQELSELVSSSQRWDDMSVAVLAALLPNCTSLVRLQLSALQGPLVVEKVGRTQSRGTRWHPREEEVAQHGPLDCKKGKLTFQDWIGKDTPRLSSAVLEMLFQAVAAHSTLSELALDGHPMTPPLVRSIAEISTKHPTLAHVSLRGCASLDVMDFINSDGKYSKIQCTGFEVIDPDAMRLVSDCFLVDVAFVSACVASVSSSMQKRLVAQTACKWLLGERYKALPNHDWIESSVDEVVERACAISA